MSTERSPKITVGQSLASLHAEGDWGLREEARGISLDEMFDELEQGLAALIPQRQTESA